MGEEVVGDGDNGNSLDVALRENIGNGNGTKRKIVANVVVE